MKDIHEYIKEAVSEKDQSILDLLNAFAKMSSGVQQALFQEKSKNADSVEHIESMEEILSKEEMEHIKKYIRPKPKMCYENAWKLCDRFGYDHDIIYCEGYLDFKGIPIEHAFNKVDGKYVDITSGSFLFPKIPFLRWCAQNKIQCYNYRIDIRI